MQHAKHLQKLFITGRKEVGHKRIHETDKKNVAELASRLIEAQEDANMQKLFLDNICSVSVDEPAEEDVHLITTLLNSPITQLAEFSLSNNAGLFEHSELWTDLLSFIQE